MAEAVQLTLPLPRRGQKVRYGDPMLPPFKFKIRKQCWIWLGATVKSAGGELYGACRDPETQRWDLVHRVMFRKYHGEIPEGHDVHHVCFTSLCGNPAHLQKAVAAANRQKMKRKRRAREGE